MIPSALRHSGWRRWLEAFPDRFSLLAESPSDFRRAVDRAVSVSHPAAIELSSTERDALRKFLDDLSGTLLAKDDADTFVAQIIGATGAVSAVAAVLFPPLGLAVALVGAAASLYGAGQMGIAAGASAAAEVVARKMSAVIRDLA